MLVPTDSREGIILVDERNRRIGTAEKYPAHRQGLLHRAFSIFLFDDEGRPLLQRRAPGKYHSAGLWANACCGHPRPGETTIKAAARRLGEELNIEAELTFHFAARYRADLGNGMTENEYVYIFSGRVPAGTIEPNPAEADAIRMASLEELMDMPSRSEGDYAYWLKHYLRNHGDQLLAMRAATAEAPARSSGAPALQTA